MVFALSSYEMLFRTKYPATRIVQSQMEIRSVRWGFGEANNLRLAATSANLSVELGFKA